MQKGLHKAHRLAQRQTEQILEGQPELNRSILELRAAPTFAAGNKKSSSALVDPGGQRGSRLARSAALLAVVFAIAGLGMRGLIHRPK